MPTEIEGWKFHEYEGMFELQVQGPACEYIELAAGDKTEMCITHETRDYSSFRGMIDTYVYVPFEVMAEFLRRNGYEVKRT